MYHTLKKCYVLLKMQYKTCFLKLKLVHMKFGNIYTWLMIVKIHIAFTQSQTALYG